MDSVPASAEWRPRVPVGRDGGSGGVGVSVSHSVARRGGEIGEQAVEALGGQYGGKAATAGWASLRASGLEG